jgi:hypothetical protein
MALIEKRLLHLILNIIQGGDAHLLYLYFSAKIVFASSIKEFGICTFGVTLTQEPFVNTQ